MVGATLAHALIFLLAILVGAIVAAVAGLIVGIPLCGCAAIIWPLLRWDSPKSFAS